MKRDYTKFIDANINGTKYCSSCSKHRDTSGGKYKVSMNGKSQRWVCSECYRSRVTVKKLK